MWSRGCYLIPDPGCVSPVPWCSRGDSSGRAPLFKCQVPSHPLLLEIGGFLCLGGGRIVLPVTTTTGQESGILCGVCSGVLNVTLAHGGLVAAPVCVLGLVPGAAGSVGELLLTRAGGVGPRLFPTAGLGAARSIPGAWVSLGARLSLSPGRQRNLRVSLGICGQESWCPSWVKISVPATML